MKRTSINTDYYWDEITNLCGELLNEMERVIKDKYNGTFDFSANSLIEVTVNGSAVTKLYIYEDSEDVVMDGELTYELENGEFNLVRELDINTMLEIAEIL